MIAESGTHLERLCSMSAIDTQLAVVTGDGHVAALQRDHSGTFRWAWDGHTGEPFDGFYEIRGGAPAVFASADGRHVAYVGGRTGRTFIGRDAAEDPPVDGYSNSVLPILSHDGAHLAYGALIGEQWRMVLDGMPIGEELAPIQAAFSPSGDRFAYVEARRLPDGKDEHRIVLDGVAGDWLAPMRNAVGTLRFSPDARRFAHYRVDGAGLGQWVLDGITQQKIVDDAPMSFTRMRGVSVLDPPLPARFSPDGRRFAYFAQLVETKGVTVIEDSRPGQMFKGAGLPVFSPDSSRLAYLAQALDGTFTLVIDGRPTTPVPGKEGGLPVFSADGRHVAVTIVRQEGGIFRRHGIVSLVLDGDVVAEQPGDEASMSVGLSPDGSRVAWAVRGAGTARMIVDREPIATVKELLWLHGYTSAGRLVYACKERGGGVTVRVDDRPGPAAFDILVPYDAILFGTGLEEDEQFLPLAISPDGEHVAWAGQFAEGARPVLDDRVGPPFDEILSWTFEPDGSPVWYVRRDDTVYRWSG